MAEIFTDVVAIKTDSGHHLFIQDICTYNDIVRYFIEKDPVGAEELHRILEERLSG